MIVGWSFICLIFISISLAPIEDIDRIKYGSLYEYVNNRYGLSLDKGDLWQTISAFMLARAQKKLFEISDEPLHKISHPTPLNDGRIFEYSETYFASSRFFYKTNR